MVLPLRKILIALSAAAIIGCGKAPPMTSPIEALADEYLAAWIEQDSLMGTYYSIAGSRHDRLPDNSLAGLTEWQQQEDDWLARFEAIEKPA